MWHHKSLPLVPICGIFCLSIVFTKWFTWDLLIIKLSKFKTYDIRKNGSKSIQLKQYFRTNNELIPPVKFNDSFVYLWKQCSFDLNPGKIKDTFKSVYGRNRQFTITPSKNKIMIVSRYHYSKLRWNLSIYELSEACTNQNLDSIVKTYVKSWLHLHWGANFRHLHLPVEKFRMKFLLLSDICRFW